MLHIGQHQDQEVIWQNKHCTSATSHKTESLHIHRKGKLSTTCIADLWNGFFDPD